MKKDNVVYLKHIIDAITWIEEYTKIISRENFMKNHLVQDGVIRQIEIIGEATKRLSDELKAKYTDIPWKDMAGMRDKLAHDYLGVDIDAVWDTVVEDIPLLKDKLIKLIE
jgi:uncharacterized protein with HEPN domain